MHKNATKCNEILSKWCKNKHGASKIMDTLETYHLIVSWGKVLGCVVCRFHVAAGEKLHADKFPGAIVQSVAKLAGINLQKFGSFCYWFDKPWFHN
jgi:hypothetical protein